jgi:hypothetical protein
MTTYQLQEDETVILRVDDTTFIPEGDGRDYQDYLAWLAEGNTPLPFDTTGQQTAAFVAAEDEERLRLVAERSATDPAYAALAELVLKGVSR